MNTYCALCVYSPVIVVINIPSHRCFLSHRCVLKDCYRQIPTRDKFPLQTNSHYRQIPWFVPRSHSNCDPTHAQVTWIGYPNTTGLPAVDYRLTDATCDPPDTTQPFSEELVRLPECFLCYTAPHDAPPVAPLPALLTGHVTFGSFNNLGKVTGDVMALWGRVLSAVPGSRLLLKSKPFACSTSQRHYLELLAQHVRVKGLHWVCLWWLACRLFRICNNMHVVHTMKATQWRVLNCHPRRGWTRDASSYCRSPHPTRPTWPPMPTWTSASTPFRTLGPPPQQRRCGWGFPA